MRFSWMVVALLGPPVALAQESPPEPPPAASGEDRARELYENGRRLYDEGAYEAAVEAWQAAYDLSRNPALLFNLASAQERLGRIDEAIASLNRYRAFATAEEAESVERRLRSLERRAEAAEAAPEPAAQATPAPTQVATTSEAPPAAPRRQASGLTVAGGVLTGLGGGGLVAGGVLQAVTLARRDDALASCVPTEGGVSCLSSAGPVIDDAQATANGRTAAFIAGGALLASGATLLIVDALSDQPARVGVAAQPTAGGALASLTVTF